MKITSLNVNRFRGCYQKGRANTVEIRSSHMERVKKFIQDYDLLTEPNDIVLLQEAPYKEYSVYYDLFKESFSSYDVIEPEHISKKKIMSQVVAVTLKESNWTKAQQPHFQYNPELDYETKVLEIENKSTHQSLINLHMPIDEEMWKCLFDTLNTINVPYTYIVGDLNAHENQHHGEKNLGHRLVELRNQGYIDLVPSDFVTYYNGRTTVDHFFYDNKQLMDKYREIEFRVLPINLSDHASLLFETKTI